MLETYWSESQIQKNLCSSLIFKELQIILIILQPLTASQRQPCYYTKLTTSALGRPQGLPSRAAAKQMVGAA